MEDSSGNELELENNFQGLQILARIIARKHLSNIQLEKDKNCKNKASKKLGGSRITGCRGNESIS